MSLQSESTGAPRASLTGLFLRTAMICLSIIAVGIAGLYLFFQRMGDIPAEVRSSRALASLPAAVRPPSGGPLLVHTSSDGALLHPQYIDLGGDGTPRSERMALVIDEVLRSAALWLTPSSNGSTHELPFIRRAAFERDGLTVVDLERAPTAPDIDLRAETLLAYGIVNSLADNFEDMQAVQFLINGEPASTLSGALDISVPLVPNVALQSGS